MKAFIKESVIRGIVRECIDRILNEKRNISSKKLFDILQQHGGFENTQKEFPDNWNLSKRDKHIRRKPISGNYSNMSDEDIIGVVDRQTLYRIGANGLRDFANENGVEVNPNDEVWRSELSDGNYVVYVDRNANEKSSHFDKKGKDGDWSSYYKKIRDREHNRYSDGKNAYLPTTDRSQAARDLKDNPYFRHREGDWKDANVRKRAMDNVRQGKHSNGGPVWRYYNGYAENDKGKYTDQYHDNGKPKMNEAMMDDFSFDMLKGKSFAAKVKYCQQMCGRQIGGGSSRIVFQIDDQWVLKLARNQKGVAQNEEEFRVATDGYGTALSVNVDESRSDTDGYEWIVSEYVLPAKPADFKHCYGIDFKDIQLFTYGLARNSSQYGQIYRKYENDEKSLEFLDEIREYWANFDPAIADASRICNWGLINRDDSPELVLLDTGASLDIIRSYYK